MVLDVLVFVLDPCFIVCVFFFLYLWVCFCSLFCRVVLGVLFSLAIFSLSVFCFSSSRCLASADLESFARGGPTLSTFFIFFFS